MGYFHQESKLGFSMKISEEMHFFSKADVKITAEREVQQTIFLYNNSHLQKAIISYIVQLIICKQMF